MCFCTPSIRTPFCGKCNQAMFLRIKELEQQRDELLDALEKICEADSDIGMWSIASETLAKVKEQT